MTEGVETKGVVTEGVVTEGVVTDGTVTDGTVTDGTVTDGVETAGIDKACAAPLESDSTKSTASSARARTTELKKGRVMSSIPCHQPHPAAQWAGNTVYPFLPWS